MTQDSSSAGSLRSARRGSSRGSQTSTSAGWQRHGPEAEIAVVHHHLPPPGEHRVARVLHHAPRCPRGRIPRRRGEFGHDPLDGVRASAARRAPARPPVGRRPPRCRRARCSRPPGYWSRSSPRAAPSSRHTTLSALRAMWVSTWPTVQPGSRLGPARHRRRSARRGRRAARPARLAHPSTSSRPPLAVRRHGAGMVDCPSSMSAMTARMNSSASSVMPPATPP